MDLERRLARLEDEREILRLAARYCHSADDRDVETFMSLWSDDAVWDVGAHRFTGVTEIEQAIRRQAASVETALHALSNSVIDVESHDDAFGRHDVITVTVLRDGRRMLLTGTYRDRYAREVDGWRISERRASVTSTSSLTGFPPPT
jgi:ketosteroid isomerase-like protein